MMMVREQQYLLNFQELFKSKNLCEGSGALTSHTPVKKKASTRGCDHKIRFVTDIWQYSQQVKLSTALRTNTQTS